MWLGVGDEGDWSLAHNNAPKGFCLEILLHGLSHSSFSTAIEAGCYALSRIDTMWPFHMPENSSHPREVFFPLHLNLSRRRPKKGEIKTKHEIKQEPTRTKRSWPISAEMSIAKRPNPCYSGKAKVTEEFERFASEDAVEKAAERDPASEDYAVTEHGDS